MIVIFVNVFVDSMQITVKWRYTLDVGCFLTTFLFLWKVKNQAFVKQRLLIYKAKGQ